MSTILAIDIGGTHVTAARVGPGGLQRESLIRRDVDDRWSAPRLLDAWADAALHAAGSVPCDRVGCAIPGPFDYRAGIAHFDQKLVALAGQDVTAGLRARWRGSPLAASPVTFVNDAVAFALGEAAAGHGRGVRRLLGITLGTGFGSGFIVGGHAVTTGPEVPPHGEVRLLPLRGGIADDHLSGPGLQRAYRRRSGHTLTARDIATRAEGGDALAAEVFAEFGHDLGTTLAPWAKRFGPDVIVFGGQLSRAWPLFAPALLRALPGVTLLQSTLLDDANLLGAARPDHPPVAPAAVPGPHPRTPP